jgi:predicted MPP superfamily phosphohydrolase
MRLFLFIFFSLYAATHVYAFLKARAALGFGPKGGFLLGLIMSFMVISPALIRVLERGGYPLAARLVAYVGYTWLGVFFLFLSLSLLMDLFRFLIFLGEIALKKKFPLFSLSSRAAFFAPLFLSVALAALGYFGALGIRTEKIVFKSPKIPLETGQLKIAQISDVHLGVIVRKGRLSRILRPVKEFAPDILVSTGDLLDGQASDMATIAESLRDLKPRYGKFAILGNHEYYVGLPQSLQFLKKAGFTLLRGERAEVAGISIAGVDDPTGKYFGLYRDVSDSKLLSSTSNGRFVLFLKHRPLVERDALSLFDLQLSGHTHKGQIFPFTLLTRLYYRLDSGYLANGAYLYVSGGSGTWGPPIRLLAPAEVTLIELSHGEKVEVTREGKVRGEDGA